MRTEREIQARKRKLEREIHRIQKIGCNIRLQLPIITAWIMLDWVLEGSK